MSGWYLTIVYLYGPSMAGVEMYVGPSGSAGNINPGINLCAASINSNVSVSPRRYYHRYGDIIIHTTTSQLIVRVYNHE